MKFQPNASSSMPIPRIDLTTWWRRFLCISRTFLLLSMVAWSASSCSSSPLGDPEESGPVASTHLANFHRCPRTKLRRRNESDPEAKWGGETRTRLEFLSVEEVTRRWLLIWQRRGRELSATDAIHSFDELPQWADQTQTPTGFNQMSQRPKILTESGEKDERALWVRLRDGIKTKKQSRVMENLCPDGATKR